LQSRITALFPAGEDVAEALAMAADSVGLTEMPQYEVVNTEEIDWVQQVQVFRLLFLAGFETYCHLHFQLQFCLITWTFPSHNLVLCWNAVSVQAN
jgi:hypothetical protein